MKGKGLFPRREAHKGENGRTDCMLCTDNTVGEAIVAFFDPTRPIDDHSRRVHLRCLIAQLVENIQQLVGDWDVSIPEHKKGGANVVQLFKD